MFRRLLPFLLAAIGLIAAAAPVPPPKPARGPKRIALPKGTVKWENVKTARGTAVRMTCGKVVVEGQRLYFGDGKGVMEVRADKKGILFVGLVRVSGPCEFTGESRVMAEGPHVNGTHSVAPGATYTLRAASRGPEALKPGDAYLISPSVAVKRRTGPDDPDEGFTLGGDE